MLHIQATAINSRRPSSSQTSSVIFNYQCVMQNVWVIQMH